MLRSRSTASKQGFLGAGIVIYTATAERKRLLPLGPDWLLPWANNTAEQ